jgi:hypothetical protein
MIAGGKATAYTLFNTHCIWQPGPCWWSNEVCSLLNDNHAGCEKQPRMCVESETENAMPLLEESSKKTKQERRHERVVWITAIVLGSILILLVILIASIDDFSWILS